MTQLYALSAIAAVLTVASCLSSAPPANVHIHDVHEISFTANKTYGNPYMDVELWVDLSGPGGTYQIPAFWDGASTWRARLVATASGTWTWSTDNSTGDSGLDGKAGTFTPNDWTAAELAANPNRRGFIRATPNGHALQYADGTPFFFTADTWWTALTDIWRWDGNGLAGIPFQQAVQTRKSQGYNGIALTACFPSDTTNGIWHISTHGKKVSEGGHTPFEYAGGEPDYTRINPSYWREADRKMAYLHEQGFATYFETVRRHEAWRLESNASLTFTAYVRYLRARYGCYNMIFGWLHWDGGTIEREDWRPHIEAAYATLGTMPYGQPLSALAYGATYDTWGTESGGLGYNGQDAPWLTTHCVGNRYRGPGDYPLLRFEYDLDLPCLNLEPFYPGWQSNGDTGTDPTDDYKSRAQMYLSVLNGGLAGHTWGSTYFAGVCHYTGKAGQNVLNYSVSPSMGHLKGFMLHRGSDYWNLVPAAHTHQQGGVDDYRGLALAADRSWGLGYITRNYNKVDIVNLPANTTYSWDWWHVENGTWISAGQVQTDGSGTLVPPAFPDTSNSKSDKDWAYRFFR